MLPPDPELHGAELEIDFPGLRRVFEIELEHDAPVPGGEYDFTIQRTAIGAC